MIVHMIDNAWRYGEKVVPVSALSFSYGLIRSPQGRRGDQCGKDKEELSTALSVPGHTGSAERGPQRGGGSSKRKRGGNW